MDEKLKILRQEVAAAEFLLRNLKAQLREAEEQAVGAQSLNNHAKVTRPNPSLSSNRPGVPGGINIEGLAPNSRGAPDEEVRPQRDATSTPHAAAGDQEVEGDEDEDAPGEEDADINAADFQLPSIEVGAAYPTLEEVKKAVTAHAISQGWTSRVYKRDRTRLLMRCRTGADCPFHLRAEQYESGAKVCALKPDHNCNFRPDQSHVIRAHATNLRFLRRELPTFLTVTEKTTAREISDAIFQRFGTRVSAKQCRHLKTTPKRRRTQTLGTCSVCGGTGHNRLTCGRDMEQQPSPSDA